MLLIQEDHRARFYAGYRIVADKYDKEFLKKHDEDLHPPSNHQSPFICFDIFLSQLEPRDAAKQKLIFVPQKDSPLHTALVHENGSHMVRDFALRGLLGG